MNLIKKFNLKKKKSLEKKVISKKDNVCFTKQFFNNFLSDNRISIPISTNAWQYFITSKVLTRYFYSNVPLGHKIRAYCIG